MISEMTNVRTQAHSRGQRGFSEVTNVIVKAGLLAWVSAVVALGLSAQDQTAPHAPGPAESLYLKLRSVGLDKSRVFKIREAALDRAAIHLSMDDGTIAFSEDAEGHITGALFLGDGDILLRPPNASERASLALFTGAAILEEKISLAYLRFNDDLYEQLRPFLRPAEDSESFVNLWNPTAKELAQEDALRLLVSFERKTGSASGRDDHLLHAYLRGQRLGTFDVRYDSTLLEQISAGQHRAGDGVNYYDVWLSFSTPTRGATAEKAASPAPEFEVSDFRIKARINIPTEVSAEARLNVTAKVSGNRIILFELSRLMQVKSVEADGRPVEFIHNQAIEGSQLARRGNDALAVFLPTSMQGGEKVELVFHYSGSVLSEAANGLLYVGERGTWYPNLGFVMAAFDLEFRYPHGWTLVATGVPTGSKIEGAEQVARWKSDRTIPVAGFNLGKYERTVTRAGSVKVETYATATMERNFPKAAEPLAVVPDPLHRPGLVVGSAAPAPEPTPSQNAEMVGNAAARAVEFYAAHFGPYPYASLELTQFPGPISQGWPGLVFLSSYSFLNDPQRERLESNKAMRLIQAQIVAHETAHQWWGDLITWNSYRDQWLMESLANYSSLMLLESRNPAGFRLVMQRYRDDLLQEGKNGSPLMNAGPVTFGLRLLSSQYPDAYNAISYGRGTWLLHMLRTMLRDAERKPGTNASEDPFLRILRKLCTDYEGRSITTTQFLVAFEAEMPRSLWYEGHKSLDWFFESWVNGSAVPRLELRDVKFAEKVSRPTASGIIVQKNAPETLVTLVPLYGAVSGRNVYLGRVFAEGHETSFRITVPAGVRKVVLDPEQTVLDRNR
jgi:hypothetical protein